MLELWKPLFTLKDKNNPVIFDELGFKYSDFNKSLWPFIIFFDENENCYYYLKAQNAHFGANHPKAGKLKPKKYGEYFIKQSLNGSKSLFTKDSYVDCSQIFKCNKELLEPLIDTDSEIYKNTISLSEYYQSEILDNVKMCILNRPPYLSIVEVKINKDGTYGESLYLCNEKLGIVSEYYDSYDELGNNFDLDSYRSNKNINSSWTTRRYNSGIYFCELFLNEYFPEEINEFRRIQELEQSKER